MAGKKNVPVEGIPSAEGANDGAPKPSETKKASSRLANQIVSEKAVRLAVFGLVLAVIGYFAYPYAETWVGSLFDEEEAASRSAETPAEISAPAFEEPTLDEPPLEFTPRPEEQITLPAVDQESRDQVSALEEPAPEISTPVADLPGFDETRISNLEAEIISLREALSERVDAPDAPAAHFASAVASLAPPLYQSQAFTGELEQIRILILGMPAFDQATLAEPLGVLSDFSGDGVPDTPALKSAFQSATLQALREQGLSETSGWWARTWARIKGLVVIRRTDIADDATLEGAILRMETRLDAGDINAALAVLDTLSVADAAAFEIWAGLARGRQQALAAFEKLINFIPRRQSGVN